MNITHIQMRGGKTTFRPGESIEGSAVWQVDHEIKSAEVRLFWYTEGKGTRDVHVEAVEREEHPATTGKIDFRFTAPSLPPSYRGHLIAFIWAIELEVKPKADVAIQPLVISPTGADLSPQASR